MKIVELELPSSLCREVTRPDGTRNKLVVPDKLISWAEAGRGGAIAELCQGEYQKNLARIQAWESERIGQLEEEQRNTGKDAVPRSRNFHGVKRYHTTREDIVREAEMKRVAARDYMLERASAIEQLVEDARSYMLRYQVRHMHEDLLHYLLLFGTLIFAIYTVIFN